MEPSCRTTKTQRYGKCENCQDICKICDDFPYQPGSNYVSKENYTYCRGSGGNCGAKLSRSNDTGFCEECSSLPRSMQFSRKHQLEKMGIIKKKHQDQTTDQYIPEKNIDVSKLAIILPEVSDEEKQKFKVKGEKKVRKQEKEKQFNTPLPEIKWTNIIMTEFADLEKFPWIKYEEIDIARMPQTFWDLWKNTEGEGEFKQTFYNAGYFIKKIEVNNPIYYKPKNYALSGLRDIWLICRKPRLRIEMGDKEKIKEEYRNLKVQLEKKKEAEIEMDHFM